jgi:hypothetical protein
MKEQFDENGCGKTTRVVGIAVDDDKVSPDPGLAKSVAPARSISGILG